MQPVRNDPEAMRELAAALRTCRAAIRDSESALRERLLVQLHQSWSDASYETFRLKLASALDVIRGINDHELEDLELRLYSLRERLLRYHQETIAHDRKTLHLANTRGDQQRLTALQIEAQRADFYRARRSGTLRLGEQNVKRSIEVAAIAPPQNEPDFTWQHHGSGKTTYMELAATFTEVTRLVRQGLSLTDLAQNDRYRQAIDAFWSRSDPIRVTQFRDIYIIEAGRHRVAAVLELGQSHSLETLVTTMTPSADKKTR